MVTVFLADGFEEIEAVTPIDILRRGGVSVRTCSITG
ncbi:MAG: DJ-1/PfpI family protein, partial [Clostridia bacterium]|nr:DJ-1/PfpI family protein [Clostridia bacterium]